MNPSSEPTSPEPLPQPELEQDDRTETIETGTKLFSTVPISVADILKAENEDIQLRRYLIQLEEFKQQEDEIEANRNLRVEVLRKELGQANIERNNAVSKCSSLEAKIAKEKNRDYYYHLNQSKARVNRAINVRKRKVREELARKKYQEIMAKTKKALSQYKAETE